MRRPLLTTICLLLTFVSAWAQRGHFFPSDQFSSSLISDLSQDREGSVWIATDHGLNRFDGYRFQTFLHDDADSTSLQANVISTIFCDREGRMWVGTNKGLDCYDHQHGTFRHYPFPDGVKPRVSSILQRHSGALLVGTAGYGAFLLESPDAHLVKFSLNDGDTYFSRMLEDSKGRIWKSGFDDVIGMREGDRVTHYQSNFGTPQGFIEYEGQVLALGLHGLQVFRGGRFVPADVDMSIVAGQDVVFTRMLLSAEGILYIGTRGHGLYRLTGRRLERVEASAIGVNQATARISAMLFDQRGNLWLACHRKGLLMLPQRPMQFSNWSFADQGISVGSTISSVCGGDNGIVWCTVQGVGVYGFDTQGRVVAHPQAPDAVEFIFRDKQGHYWIGTDDGLFAYDPLTGHSQLKVNFECDMFHDMTSDKQGRIYISTFSRGFCVYDPQTGSLLNHNISEPYDSVKGRLGNNWVMGLSADRRGLIWLATSSGVSCYDPSTDGFRTQGWDQLLPGVVCFDVCELHSGQLPDGRSLDGCIAIGTEHGLYLYDIQSHRAELFPGSDELQNKAISYIVQSNDGDLWCSTSMGIWQYQIDSHSFVGHISGNGLLQKEYLYGVGMHSDDDIVYFGHNDGLAVFHPSQVKESHHAVDPLFLTAFRVGSQYVEAGTVINDVVITDRAVSQSNYFTLSYLDHTVTLGFSQFNFDDPANIILEYNINGGDWIRNSPGQNEFTLGHLQPGTYRIAVRALQGADFSPEKIVVVTIRNPWYRSVWAYFLYALVALALLGYLFYTYRRRANQQMDEEKMKFLINATHDIRSPLTLIMGPLEKMKQAEGADRFQAPIETIERNAKRILDLVNQILDVRKIDKQQMHLHCQATEMVAFVRGICKMYEFNAQERNIDFRFDSDVDQVEAWVDRSQFDKVVSNLLSNAFKYCGEDGTVRVRLTHDSQSLSLQVSDNGVGLDGESLKHIFDRFYQASNARKLNIKGTGIGLNLCKMIVDMHHGTIVASNRPGGERGALFTVTLPLGNSHLAPEEIDTDVAPTTPVAQGDAAIAAAAAAPKHTGGKRRRVLVVDDDDEIVKYICTELGQYYKFGTASNGKDGLKELLTNDDYDLVISDVMMPEMDGFTMLRMIKTNINIAHIPVVMLTSMADVGNRLEGLERGADAFLAKPFNLDELHMTIDNLIQTRQRLKGKFTGAQQQADKVELPEVKGNDELLMERIMKAVNKNLSNSDFNVDMLTQEVGISRAQLHRKMKEMTGISTSEFIRNIRLEQAARLLKEQKINITQVAYTVGFSNLAHFSTIFRKHFGVAPSEYAESGK